MKVTSYHVYGTFSANSRKGSYTYYACKTNNTCVRIKV